MKTSHKTLPNAIFLSLYSTWEYSKYKILLFTSREIPHVRTVLLVALQHAGNFLSCESKVDVYLWCVINTLLNSVSALPRRKGRMEERVEWRRVARSGMEWKPVIVCLRDSFGFRVRLSTSRRNGKEEKRGGSGAARRCLDEQRWWSIVLVVSLWSEIPRRDSWDFEEFPWLSPKGKEHAETTGSTSEEMTSRTFPVFRDEQQSES